ncbi:uncharacterized protein, partial [Cardiocondyla obscurior]|uniref:uncharacterized protein n=1 Tax=Cardiocondyla obscurior TaxID=286306 RepID=UPI00396577A2
YKYPLNVSRLFELLVTRRISYFHRAFQLTGLLTITWCTIIAARSELAENNEEPLLKRAAEQLERLAPYRRTADDRETELSSLLEAWKSSLNENQLERARSDVNQNVAWEIQSESDALAEQIDSKRPKRTDDEKLITIDLITDPRYTEMMQERIKRGFDVGSTSLLTSIAGGVLSGVASASSGSAAKASAGSSQSAHKPVYGAPTIEHAYSYEEKPFGPWEFKKAIFSTLFQALKAIGGGVLALKGQLVKGGGYLLAGKGKVVSKAGDAITSLGKQLAANAIPKPYPEPYYPPIPHIGHDSSYSGLPPSPNEYSEVPTDFAAHETYGVPSDDNGQGGLLIVTKSDQDKHGDQHTSVAVQENPDPAKLAESFGGPTQGSVIKNLLNSVPKGSAGSKDQIVVDQNSLNNNHNNNVDPHASQHPTYDLPNRYPANHDNPTYNYEQNYPAAQSGAYQQPELPQTTLNEHYSNLELDPNLSNVGYPPIHHFQYPNPHSSLLDSQKLAHNDNSDTSIYASVSVDTEPQIAPLKVPLLGNPITSDLPKLQSHVDFQPQFTNSLHGTLSGPLRVPLLSPMPSSYYWQGQGSLAPTSTLDTLDHFRKRNVHRRAFAERFARYALQSMRRHRL